MSRPSRVQSRTATPSAWSRALPLTYTPLVEKVNYSLEDFKYLASVGRYQEAFVAPPDKPYKNFKELVAYAKKNPGLTYASMHPIAENILTAVAKKEGH